MEVALKEAQRKWKSAEAKVLAFQLWMENQILLGLIDIEKTPACFDRSKVILPEPVLGSHCHYCNHKFEPREHKVTDNHIMFFHPGCKEAYYKMENRMERFENREDGN